MTGSIRTAVLGVLAGASASAPLALCLGHPRASVAFGLVIGIAYAASTRRTPQAYVDNLMAGGALGVPLWGLISVVALPVLSRQRLEWTGEEMRAHFPALVVWVLYGALLGLFTKALSDFGEHVFGPETLGIAPIPPQRKRIVILGGGFAGMKTAECLDCAAVNDAKTGKSCPPTAQFAIREAATVARNIAAQLGGRPLKRFHFDSLGALCVVGHQTACAEFRVPFVRSKSVRFSGLLAWLMWRGIYLSKLPGMERKIRVLMDWTIELFFPRDIVQTINLQQEKP